MGNTALVLPSSVPIIAGSPDNAGSLVGGNDHVLTSAQIPSHTHSGTTGRSNQDLSHSHTAYVAVITGNGQSGGEAGRLPGAATVTTSVVDLTYHYHNFTTDGGAGLYGSAHNNMPLTVLGSFYRKL